jgi:hypothetical protein
MTASASSPNSSAAWQCGSLPKVISCVKQQRNRDPKSELTLVTTRHARLPDASGLHNTQAPRVTTARHRALDDRLRVSRGRRCGCSGVLGNRNQQRRDNHQPREDHAHNLPIPTNVHSSPKRNPIERERLPRQLPRLVTRNEQSNGHTTDAQFKRAVRLRDSHLGQLATPEPGHRARADAMTRQTNRSTARGETSHGHR